MLLELGVGALGLHGPERLLGRTRTHPDAGALADRTAARTAPEENLQRSPITALLAVMPSTLRFSPKSPAGISRPSSRAQARVMPMTPAGTARIGSTR